MYTTWVCETVHEGMALRDRGQYRICRMPRGPRLHLWLAFAACAFLPSRCSPSALTPTPRRVCVHDITNYEQWIQNPQHIYVGRSTRWGACGYGTDYSVNKYGRENCVRLYVENQLPTLSTKQLKSIRLASEIGCHCDLKDLCHSDFLIKASLEEAWVSLPSCV